jgi:hypothetical protein
MLENTATSSSGMVLGELGTEYVIMVGWLTTVLVPDLEVSLNAGFENMEAQGNVVLDRGELVTSTKDGDEMKFQYCDATIEGKTFHGVFGVWYNDTSDRFYELMILYSGQDVLPKFQQYLDSFVG